MRKGGIFSLEHGLTDILLNVVFGVSGDSGPLSLDSLEIMNKLKDTQIDRKFELESLINETQSGRIEKYGKYTHIKSVFDFKKPIIADNLRNYNSMMNPLTKQELKDYLISLGLIS